MSFGNKIRKLDVFKKIPNELSEGTNLGGIISIFTAVSILTLISIQVYNFINPGYSTMLLPMRREFRNKMKYKSHKQNQHRYHLSQTPLRNCGHRTTRRSVEL